jgi:NAD(P)-dependent dehydrogenase (short-subunit alcohol dehydrogenase family)
MRKGLVLVSPPCATIRPKSPPFRGQTSEQTLSKIIVITGSGVGLGRALARRFASEGETVILLGRTASKVEAVASELGGSAMGIGCDVSSPDAVRAAFAKIAERHPKIDVLINNAAIFEPSTIAEASDEHILQTISTNLLGTMYCARAAIPMMERGGHIINVSSESVELPFAMLIAYQASKAGVEKFSWGLQLELESSGIRVTTIRAGQMYEEGKATNWDPAAAMRFAVDTKARGLDLMSRPISHFGSVTGVFRAVIDLPPDVHVANVELHARHQS